MFLCWGVFPGCSRGLDWALLMTGEEAVLICKPVSSTHGQHQRQSHLNIKEVAQMGKNIMWPILHRCVSTVLAGAVVALIFIIYAKLTDRHGSRTDPHTQSKHSDYFLYLDPVSAGVLRRTRRGAWLSPSLHVWINLLWTLTACQHLGKKIKIEQI